MRSLRPRTREGLKLGNEHLSLRTRPASKARRYGRELESRYEIIKRMKLPCLNCSQRAKGRERSGRFGL